MTPEKIELGKLLYFDKRLSKDGTVSCATCHDPRRLGGDGAHLQGNRQPGRRPQLAHGRERRLHGGDVLGRPGQVLEEQASAHREPIEMGQKMDLLIPELAKVPDYVNRFKKVFGTEITKEGSRRRSPLRADHRERGLSYDRHVAGDARSLTDAQKKGLETFNKAGCGGCHAARFSRTPGSTTPAWPATETGRKVVTGKDEDMGKFRVPALREVASTPPYFHDGSAKTLDEAVDLMAAGGKDNPNLSTC